jgi:acetyl-CoA acyltransferase
MGRDVVIVAAKRSPMGRALKGQFAHTRIDDLAAEVIQGTLSTIPQLKGEAIEDFLLGCAMPEGEQGLNVARNVGFLAGLPHSVGAATVNRFCASSLTTINMAAAMIAAGDAEVVLAGGIESMSHVPMGGFNPSLNQKFFADDVPEAYIGMGTTAENLAKKFSISREAQDAFALASHQKAVAAIAGGKFADEIVACTAVAADGTTRSTATDEGPRPDSSIEALTKLKPAFEAGGTVTAGNSSPLTDGAAAVVLMSETKAKTLGIVPIARIRGYATAGVDPATMGEGPTFAIPKALNRAGMTLGDIDCLEINEAFAAQILAVVSALELDTARLNIHGGAIALGHPLGCTGARIMATLLHALKRTGKSVGLESMCVGGGQGVATIVEMC